MEQQARHISWIRAALREFNSFPDHVREQITTALRLAVRGEKAVIAKPMRGFGRGIFEIAVAHRGDAYRTVYAILIGEDLWVVHTFRKKSTRGITTPKKEIDLIRSRIRQRREQLKHDRGT